MNWNNATAIATLHYTFNKFVSGERYSFSGTNITVTWRVYAAKSRHTKGPT